MIISIHQPNYLPWSGFFHKLSLCDAFVLLDTVPFSKNGYQNRCRIKGASGGQWLSVPVRTKGRLGQPTNQVEFSDTSFAKKHWRTLDQCYRKCPGWGATAEWLQPALIQTDSALLSQMTSKLIREAARCIGADCRIVNASQLDVQGTRSELLASICEKMEATEYISGPSGRGYLDLEPFERLGVSVSFHQFSPPEYPGQPFGDFEKGLSIVDLIAAVGPDAVLDTLAPCGTRNPAA